jgi:hypothetical protein
MLLAAVAITMSPQSADAQYPHPSSFQQYSSAPAQTYVPPSYGQAPTQNGQAPTQNGRIQYGQTQAPYGQVQSQYGQTNGQYSRQQNPYSRPQVMHSQPRSMQSRPQVMHNQPGISGATANQNSNQPAYSPYGPSMARPWRPTYHAPQSQQGAMPVSQTLGPQLNGLSSVKSPGPNAIPYQVPAPNYRPGPNYGPSTNYGSIDWGGTAGGCNGCGSGGCGSGGCNEGGCAPRCSNRWYGSIAPITMTRNRPPRLWTSYETGNNPNQILHTQHAEADWGVGGEIVLGYCLPCWCDWSIEFSYWGLEPLDGSASITHANMVSTPVDVAGIEFGTVNGTVLFDSAAEHRIWRRNEIHNFEVNLVQGRCGSTAGCGGCGGAWDTGFMFGARIFSFDENLIWGSLNTGGTWGGNGGLDEAYVDVDVENLLADSTSATTSAVAGECRSRPSSVSTTTTSNRFFIFAAATEP